MAIGLVDVEIRRIATLDHEANKKIFGTARKRKWWIENADASLISFLSNGTINLTIQKQKKCRIVELSKLN